MYLIFNYLILCFKEFLILLLCIVKQYDWDLILIQNEIYNCNASFMCSYGLRMAT